MTSTITSPPPPPSDDPERSWVRPALIGAVVLAAVAVVVTIKVRWWRRGGPRRAIEGLAEAGAVALADALVDELLPAA